MKLVEYNFLLFY